MNDLHYIIYVGITLCFLGLLITPYLMFFWRDEAPAQRAVGDYPPFKELPERGPAAGAFKKIITSFLISK